MKIINLYKGNCPRNIEKMIKKLLRDVPEENMVGLYSIVIVNKSAQKKSTDARGLYIPQYKNELPRIELAVDNIFFKMKRIFFFFPFIPKYALANVLYHEIGHHYQSKHVRMKKEYQEDYAKKFCKKMLKKEFFWWIFFLRPIVEIYGRSKGWDKEIKKV